ncbi:MAG: IS66 family insertion sequence element accessory protein TnpB [Verrucomicrobiales bacterium]|nr:IS66 family insertion sequence element accessory protein TnpB [Verrucomicrobiales bacterium]
MAIDPCDMRKEFNGFYALVTERLGEEPRNGALLVFTNRRLNRLKIHFSDRTGLRVCNKRLEDGSFSWPRAREPRQLKISFTPEAVMILTDGVDLRGARLRPRYQRE